jgi:hypothetical protein
MRGIIVSTDCFRLRHLLRRNDIACVTTTLKNRIKALRNKLSLVEEYTQITRSSALDTHLANRILKRVLTWDNTDDGFQEDVVTSVPDDRVINLWYPCSQQL